MHCFVCEDIKCSSSRVFTNLLAWFLCKPFDLVLIGVTDNFCLFALGLGLTTEKLAMSIHAYSSNEDFVD